MCQLGEGQLGCAACCGSGLGETGETMFLYVFYSLWVGRLPESMAWLPPDRACGAETTCESWGVLASHLWAPV